MSSENVELVRAALQAFNQITKIRNHFGRAAGQIDSWNVGPGEPIDDMIDRLAGHDLLALWSCIHVAMNAGEIAQLPHVHLKNLRPRSTQHQTLAGKSFGKTIHEMCVASQ